MFNSRIVLPDALPAWDMAAILALDVRMDAAAEIVTLTNEIEELRTELADLYALDDAEIKDEELDRIDEVTDLIKKKERILQAKQRLVPANTPPRSRRRTPPAAPADPDPTNARGERVPAQPRNADDDARHGFGFFGEFAQNVLMAYKGNNQALDRFENVATTFGTEGVGADGGYLVPPQFREEIWQKVSGEDSLMSRCAQFTTAKNSLTFPKDETTPWDNSSSGGIRVFWEGEGDQSTASKPKFETETARLNKLMALIKITEELLDDAPGLDSYLRRWTPIKMQHVLNTAIVRGNGTGKPHGLIGAASTVTVSKENSQDAASILFPNINNMWNRLYSDLRSNSVWLINQEIEPQLEGMQFLPANEHGSATTSSSNVPVYLPAGGVADTPFARLKGRPVLPMQPCSALGTLGDIILTDLQQYMILTKGSGVQQDVSMHLHFDQAIETFRFIFRVTGQPLWNSVINPENGSNTYGSAVVLETRS